MQIETFAPSDFYKTAYHYDDIIRHSPMKYFDNKTPELKLKQLLNHAVKSGRQQFLTSSDIKAAIKSYYSVTPAKYRSTSYQDISGIAAHIATNYNLYQLHNDPVKAMKFSLKIPRFRSSYEAIEWFGKILKKVLRMGLGAFAIGSLLAGFVAAIGAGVVILGSGSALAATVAAIAATSTLASLLGNLVAAVVIVEGGAFIGGKVYKMFKGIIKRIEANKLFEGTDAFGYLKEAFMIVEMNNGKLDKKQTREVIELLEGAEDDAKDLKKKLGKLHPLVKEAEKLYVKKKKEEKE